MAEDSLTLAKAYQAAERRRVQRVTGIVVTDHGCQLPPVKIKCPRCWFVASATSDGLAVRYLGAHIVSAHCQEQK